MATHMQGLLITMLPCWDRVAPALELLIISFLSIFPTRSRTGQSHVEFSFCHKDARSSAGS